MTDPTNAAYRRRCYFLRWAVAIYVFGWTFSIGFDAEADSPSRWYPVYAARGYHGG